jgi:hypothetical protein
MAKSLLSSTIALTLLIFISSCSSNNNTVSHAFLQKRKHTKGYHVNLGSSRHNANKKTKAFESLADEESSQIFEEEHQPLAQTKTEIQPKIEHVKTAKTREIIHSAKEEFFAESAKATSVKDLIKINKEARKSLRSKLFIEEPTDGISPDRETKDGMVGFSIAGFVISLVGLLIAGIILGTVAIIFSAIGLAKALKEERKGAGLAIAGLIIGVIDIVGAIVFAALLLA